MRVFVACLAALLGAGGMAEAAEWKPVGMARGGVLSDGARWVLMQRSASRVVVVDDLLRRRFAVAVRRSCFAVYVGSGDLLVMRCPSVSSPEGPRAVYDLIDLRSGGRQTVAVPALDVDYEEVVGVGRVWLRLRYSGYHYWGERYFNRLTGAIRTADGPRFVPKLDDPGLEARLCDPLRRPADSEEAGYEEGSPWVTFTYDGRAAAYQHPKRLDSMLWRCGVRHPQRLTSGPSSAFGQTELGGGWAVFLENRDITALRYRDGRRVHLRVPLRWKRKATDKAHIRRFVYLAVQRTGKRVARVPHEAPKSLGLSAARRFCLEAIATARRPAASRVSVKRCAHAARSACADEHDERERCAPDAADHFPAALCRENE